MQNKTETSFDESPDFLVTRCSPFRSSNREILNHIVHEGNEKPENVATAAEAEAVNVVEQQGGFVEVWKRVACFKAEAKPWD